MVWEADVATVVFHARSSSRGFARSKVKSMASLPSPALHRTIRQTKIVIEEARKVYQTQTGQTLALDDVSATIKEGEFVCIVGPSGCGKTTLLWALSGLHPLHRAMFFWTA